MKKHASLQALAALAMFAGLWFPDSSAWANGCSSKAAQLASQNGGRVLSAVARGNKCHIKILVRNGNGPPKRRSFVVSK